MKIGDKVIVTHSPYSCIKNGTIATIKDIKFAEMGKRWELYILDTKPCSSFREHEIELR